MPYNVPTQQPFSPTVVDLQPETLPMDEIIRRAVDDGGMRLRVCMPAKVVKITGNQQVDLQPLLQARLIDNTIVTLPVIANALVCMPMGQDYAVKYPIAVGDTGVALFCDRSLDAWAASMGDVVDPKDSRMHALSDAIFLPGLVPLQKQFGDTTDDMVLRNGEAELRLQKDGRFVLKNKSQEMTDLLDLVIKNQVDLLEALASNTFTLTMLGPQPFIASTVAALQQLKQTAQTIRDNFDTLKGAT